MRRGRTDLVAWIGGHDIARSGTLLEVTPPNNEAVGAAVQVFGSPVDQEEPIGVVSYSARFKGYADRAAVSLLKAIGETAGVVAVIGTGGTGLGASCDIAESLGRNTRQWDIDPADFSKVDLGFTNRADSPVYEDARLLAGGLRVGAAVGAPYTGYRLDLGADAGARNGGIAIAVMASEPAWDGATNLRVRVRHSNTANAAGPWDDLAELNLAAPAAAAAGFATERAQIRRYLAAEWTWTGGNNPTAKVLVAFALTP